MILTLRKVFLTAVLMSLAAVAALAQEDPRPTAEQVDSVCGFYDEAPQGSALFRAIADDDLAAAAAAAGAWSGHDRSYGGFPGPIYWAIRFGNLAMVQTLVAHGIRADETENAETDFSWDIPVVFSALENGRVDIAKFLVENGAAVHAGYVLQYAIAHGDADLFSFALQRVQNVDGSWGLANTTPLMDAAAAGNMDFVTALVARGANVNAAAERPADDPLAVALKGHHVDVARFLLSKGAKPSVYALEAALSTGQADMAADFLRHGVQPRGASLVAACRGQLPQFVSRFLAQGVSPFSEDFEGNSAADAALELNNTAILKMLTDKGAKPATPFQKEFEVTDDHVNVRDAPDVKQGKVLRQLSRGDRVQAVKMTQAADAIGDFLSPWYRVRIPLEPRDFDAVRYLEGWVYGAYLSGLASP